MSALRTAPQVYPEPNTVHDAATEPLLAVTGGSARPGEIAEATIRRPCEPVSTWMSSMVWQLLVPGTQIVTLVCSMLRVPVWSFVTWIGWTLGVVDWATALSGGGAEAGAAPEATVVEEAGAAAAGVPPAGAESPPPPPLQP
jgi:hypothetical protein